MSNFILISDRSNVRTIALNRPEVFNSFTREMGQQFQQALDAAASDPNVRCVVITGEGRAFCAGQDLKEVTAPDAPDFTVIVEETYNQSIRRIRSMEKPVIGALNGVAAGAGANIALACDLVIAKESASLIQAFSKIGLIPDSGGTWFLPRMVGMQRAAALAFFGDKLSAKDAVEMGLIYRAVQDDAFAGELEKLGDRLAALPTRGIGLTKKAFNASWNQPLSEHLTFERDLQMEASQTDDYHEGVSAFLEKRSPKFTGQ
jgi:2-(1,2-epoxy-1,2-dihydrophenyl)acetyl-CoA isomerase